LAFACSQGAAEREDRVAAVIGGGDAVAAPAELGDPPQPTAAELEGTPVGEHGALRFEGTQLVDQNGVAVQLKGPSSMWLNWERAGYASNRDLVTLLRDDWGASVVRAAMGVDASSGPTYLANRSTAVRDVRLVIDNAISLGLYVIIDWHDHEAASHEAEAIAFFEEMATLYGEYPNVIYETFNEPLVVSWSDNLKPYHERVVAAIRAIDPDNLIIMGTPNWSQYVDEAAADPVAGDNLAYTLHFYSCTHDAWLRGRADTALSAGIPLFVTEWGATHADGGTPDNPGLCLDEARIWHDWMNTNGVSWAAWKLDGCEDSSCFFTPGAPVDGSFSEAQLTEHGAFIREQMGVQ
jgi:endoglucanase